ncbi:hypothetical protein [Inquilinus limosus]|uniref:Uncharacterized protein n=1 Tax=Inquilinus limosus TaxID=171674 RepID=A0A211ZIC7_9PROT|nr:hypothetical protein [Inquilinus limosus]OWJ65019.1 hypothetical protein BWR60_21880 [Inquilinus limosus]
MDRDVDYIREELDVVLANYLRQWASALTDAERPRAGTGWYPPLVQHLTQAQSALRHAAGVVAAESGAAAAGGAGDPVPCCEQCGRPIAAGEADEFFRGEERCDDRCKGRFRGHRR